MTSRAPAVAVQESREIPMGTVGEKKRRRGDRD
jgi:hypothetical protein